MDEVEVSGMLERTNQKLQKKQNQTRYKLFTASVAEYQRQAAAQTLALPPSFSLLLTTHVSRKTRYLLHFPMKSQQQY
jgi:hypothetical protein